MDIVIKCFSQLANNNDTYDPHPLMATQSPHLTIKERIDQFLRTILAT